MARALWVLRLPTKARILVSAGKTVSLGEKLAKKGKKAYSAPVAGKIIRVGTKEVELQFEAKKIDGRGLGKGHCWGEIAVVGEQDFTGLNINHQDKIILLRKINRLVISKAQALGIKGLIGLKWTGAREKICRLPVLLLTDEAKLALVIQEAKGVKCLLEVDEGYLLIPKK